MNDCWTHTLDCHKKSGELEVSMRLTSQGDAEILAKYYRIVRKGKTTITPIKPAALRMPGDTQYRCQLNLVRNGKVVLTTYMEHAGWADLFGKLFMVLEGVRGYSVTSTYTHVKGK